ncbi:MAG TPA: hypothetical protein PLK29_10525 [Chiayiivirga sp.]|nr:hypothetical protein [Chiayiivirga sp.]
MNSKSHYVGDGFEIHFSFSAGVLRAQVEGPHDSYEISVAYWEVVAKERAHCGATRLLVVENLASSTGHDVTLRMADEILKLDLAGCRVAFVDRGLENRSVQEVIAMQARELGIIATVFGQEAEALNWLRHGED